MVFDDILASLPGLSPAELARLTAAIKALGGTHAPSAPKGATAPADAVLRAIHTVSCDAGLGAPSLALLRRAAPTGFAAKADALWHYLDAMGGTHLQREAVLQLGLRLLLDNVRDLGLPPSPVMLVRHVHRVPELLDRAFPGYHALGLLTKVVAQRRSSYER